MHYFQTVLDYIFFFYGLSFLLLAAVSFFLSRKDGEDPAWRWLVLFGLSHGLNEWLDLLAFTFSDGPAFSAARLLLMAASFVFLLEFGRRHGKKDGAVNFSALAYALLLPLAGLGVFYGFSGLNAGIRYALGLPAGLAACLVFYRAAAGKPAALRRPLLAAGAAFGLYALAAGAVAPESALMPARWLNHNSFFNFFSFPVQLLRGLLAAAAAAGCWIYFINSGRDGSLPKAGRKAAIGWALLASLLLTLAAGWSLTDALGRSAFSELARDNENMETILRNRMQDSIQVSEQTAEAMSGSPWVPEAFPPGRPAAHAKALTVLDRYCASYGLAVCYLIDMKGTTIASSNRNTPQNFTGKSYAFRPYFKEAAAGRPGRYFALGVTTCERGYYASAPVKGAGGKTVGVAVVKKTLNFLAKELLGFPYVFLVSPEGVIFISSRPELLFRSLWPVPESARTALAESKQFGKLDFEPVLKAELEDDGILDYAGDKFYVSRSFLEQKGWSLISLASTRPVRMARFAAILLSFVLCMLLLAFFLLLVQSESAREEAEATLRLKEEVKTLIGIVPICASCKKIRDDKGYWDKVETYVARHTEAKFSHGLCPACVRKLYPDYADEQGPEEKT